MNLHLNYGCEIMKKIAITDNSILFSRKGELVKISACGENAIRFQGFPDCKVIEEDYNLMPQKADVVIEDNGHWATITCGKLKCILNGSGRVEFYSDGKEILSEKPELTFEDGYRNYPNKGSGLWSARVTFKPHDGEHFFGMGHSWDNEFDLKGSTIDIRNVNAKCTIPYVYSSLGYGFLWNVPSTGLCELSNTRTRWNSD